VSAQVLFAPVALWNFALRAPGEIPAEVDHPDVRITPDDYDCAGQECFIRIVKMLGNFRGVGVGEFLGALRTCVSNTCMDYCRRRLTRERGIAGSIDEPAPASPPLMMYAAATTRSVRMPE